MIISVTDLKQNVNTTDADDIITRKLESIETVIRKYTNNNFQQREIRFTGHSDDWFVYGDTQYLEEGDTVQISQSGVNDGLYIVVFVGVDYLELDKPIKPTATNLVTKINYPADVIQCAVDLYKWRQNMSDKVGIKSETISRHSVTYEDSATLFMGYPVGILNGLSLYKKARC